MDRGRYGSQDMHMLRVCSVCKRLFLSLCPLAYLVTFVISIEPSLVVVFFARTSFRFDLLYHVLFSTTNVASHVPTLVPTSTRLLEWVGANSIIRIKTYYVDQKFLEFIQKIQNTSFIQKWYCPLQNTSHRLQRTYASAWFSSQNISRTLLSV